MASVSISSITFEHHPTGFGIGHASPRISWRFCNEGELQNWNQESYEIQISRQGSSEPKVYRLESSESILVPWPDHDLESRDSASVRVRSHGKSTDAAGNITRTSTEWSSPVNVEAGLLDKEDWTAKLTTSTILPKENEAIRPVLFRKVFPLPEHSGAILRARLYITAHGVYHASINGQRIGKDEMAPGWTSYGHRLLYQTLDVTSSLKPGQPNVFAIEVGEGWFAGRLGMDGRRCLYGSRLAFLAQLEILLENDHKYTVVSDGTWKSHSSAITRSEVYDGEDYDSREEQENWNSHAIFDETSWASTEELRFPSARLLASDSPSVQTKQTISPREYLQV